MPQKLGGQRVAKIEFQKVGHINFTDGKGGVAVNEHSIYQPDPTDRGAVKLWRCHPLRDPKFIKKKTHPPSFWILFTFPGNPKKLSRGEICVANLKAPL